MKANFQSVVNIERKANLTPTNLILFRYEDSTTQPDTEAKEDDNEHGKINIGKRVIALQVTNAQSTIKNKSVMRKVHQ